MAADATAAAAADAPPGGRRRQAAAGHAAKTAPSSKAHRAQAHHARAPSTPPPFTVKDLRRAVPPECFVRSLPTSLAYLALDLVLVGTLFLFASRLIPRLVALVPPSAPPAARLAVEAALWLFYWFFQGAHCTGLWVTAHECGHGAFSDSPLLNDLVGYVIHTAMLVPYYSWKHSHRRHHSNTGSVERDEVFVPVFSAEQRPLWHKPWYRFGHLTFQQVAGWPSYLLFNASGREYSAAWVSHFNPFSPIFSPRERAEVGVSALGVGAMAWLLYSACESFGAGAVLKVYGLPYLIVNFWLVMITYLQHTHPSLPHYREPEWDWLRGALSTVDRSYGRYLDWAFHHIADTHVAHHLFSGMPHYHAEKATRALKEVLGEYYQQDGRNVFRAMWEDARDCHFVAAESEEAQAQQQEGKDAPKGGGKDVGGDVKARRGVLWYRSVAAKAA
jgi:omega-6 fatty acid desaturase / acyl-lipid omega-6 desaturase (Delta-12 desaturase)